MGFFDFLFGNKKEKEHLEKERQAEQERIRLAEEARMAKERELRLAENRRKEAERQARLKVETERKRNEQQSANLSSSSSNTHNIKREVDDIISTFESKNISLLQNKLFQLYSKFNKPGGGKLITSFSEKDRLSEVFCLCLQYDWMHDNDIREVWAEDGFYCIADYFKQAKTQQDYFAAALDLFLICAYGKQNLYPKFNDIMRKANMHPFHSSVFSSANYAGGAAHLVREFMFFSATIISPVVKMHPNVISPSLQNEYQKAKTDFEFASVSPEEILKKMTFISSVIGLILEEKATKWSIKTTRKFTDDEIAAVSSAIVVPSQYGNCLCFHMVGGGKCFIPMSNGSTKGVGDSVDLKTAELITLEKVGENDIYRVKA